MTPAVPAFLHPFARPAATDFVKVVRGEGCRIWDDTGRSYLDAMASLWYCGVGHGRPEIADAVATQMRTLEAYQCFDMFTNEPADALAERIARLAEAEVGPAARVFLTSGGSEAVDTALKLARLAQVQAGHPERTLAISRAPSYHGVNYGGMALTGLPLNAQGFGPGLPDVIQVPKDDLESVRAVFDDNPGRVAAVFAEPVIGAGGVFPPEPGYLAALRSLCDEYGAFLVLDEVICGFGRLGAWFGGERYGVRADLATFAKGVTSGYVPLGGVVVGRGIADLLEGEPEFVLRHGYTYSGHPSACAAAATVLDIIEEEGLLERAGQIGAQLSAGLEGLRKDGLCEQVRGDAAVWAVGLAAGIDPVAVRARVLDSGVIVRPIAPSTLAMCPPLIMQPDEVDELLAALRGALTA